MDGPLAMLHYTMCGLDYVYLRSGYRTHETEYGPGVSIERADALDRAIAIHVVASYSRLRGQEVRFLRSLMDWSQAQLARFLGVKRITVARWESALDTPIPGPADRVIRIAAAKTLMRENAADRICEIFADIEDDQPERLIMTYAPDDKAESETEPSLFPEQKSKESDGWHKDKAA